MEESQKIALSHMRDAMEQLGCSSKTFGDATLMRFLKATCMDANMGAKMLAEWRRWRESFVPLGYPEREVSHQLERRKIYLAGPSRHGRPILIVQDRKHFLHKDHLQLKSMFNLSPQMHSYSMRFDEHGLLELVITRNGIF